MRSVFQIFVIAMGICFCCPQNYAAIPPEFRSWSTSDGFDESPCFNIWFDSSSGGIYIAHGSVPHISFLDGYHVSQIPSPHIHPRLIEDPAGQLWTHLRNEQFQILGSHILGFQRYDPNTKTWKPFPLPKEYIIEDLSLLLFLGMQHHFPVTTHQIVFSSNGKILDFDTLSGAVHTILNASERQIEPLTISKGYIPFFPSRDGGIWIAGKKGLLKGNLDSRNEEEAWTWTEYPIPIDALYRDMGNILEREDGVVFATSHSTVTNHRISLKLENGKWDILFSDENEDINAAWSDQSGRLWVQKNSKLYCGYQSKEDDELPLVLSENYANGTIYLDRNDIFFVSSYTKGLLRYSPPLWEPIRGMPPQTMIARIAEDPNGCVWFAGNNALIRLDHGRWETFPYPPNLLSEARFTEDLCCMPNGRIYITLSDSLLMGSVYSLNPETKTYEQLHHPAGALKHFCPRTNGTIGSLILDYENQKARYESYNGTGFHTIFSVDLQQLERIVFKVFSGQQPRSILETASGDLWLAHASQYGPVLYRNGEWHVFGMDSEYPGTGAFYVFDAGDGKIWAGGRDEICEYNGHSWRIVRHGLDSVRSMMKDRHGRIWVASGNGVHCYDNGSWVDYTEKEGITGESAWKVFEDSHGRVWAGTTQGIRCLNPERDQDPPIVEIPPEQNNRFVALNGNAQFVYEGMDKWKYTPKDRLSYSYRFNDEDWSPYTNKTVTVRKGLPAGPHRFEVRAMDLNWNPSEPNVWEFEVVNPWYFEPAFLILITICIVLILFFATTAINRHSRLVHYKDRLEVSVNHLNQSNAELQHANAQLLELDKLKSAFVSQASHDLRTPLTAIKGSLDNLLLGIAGALNEKQEKIMSRAVKSVDRLTDLVNDVLDLSRIESGRMVLEKSNVPIKTLVENIINENKPAAEKKRIQLTANLETDATIHADAAKLERVVGELISNAIKYTPEGGNVDVSLTQTGNQITLSVQDTGIGMTQEECERIWERFYRTNASKSFAKGSGLGLSIAMELIEMHGGMISVESEPGKGSRFIMNIPC